MNGIHDLGGMHGLGPVLTSLCLMVASAGGPMLYFRKRGWLK